MRQRREGWQHLFAHTPPRARQSSAATLTFGSFTMMLDTPHALARQNFQKAIWQSGLSQLLPTESSRRQSELYRLR